MTSLFRIKKKAPPPNVSETIQKLRETQLILEKREAHLERQIQSSRSQAKLELQQKKKSSALLSLRRAKLYEKEINSSFAKRSNLDVQILLLEGAAANAQIFQTMQQSRDALKAATNQVDVDKVSDVMEDITESIQMNEEVNEVLTQQIGPTVDEAELTAELQEMEQEIAKEEIKDFSSIDQLPPLPTTTTSIKTAPISTSTTTTPAVKKSNMADKEAGELKKLEAMMGM